MKRHLAVLLSLLLSVQLVHGQIPGLEAKNWYFGTGVDGFVFDPGNIPYKVNNKMSGVGFEGMVVVSDPLSGALLFYSDGQTVVNAAHAVMFNGTGLYGHASGAQTVNCTPVPNQLGKFYLFTSRAWDLGGDNLFYSIVDFTDPGYPLGKVTNKNTLLSGAIYGQANKVISKPGTTDYWWIGHVLGTNTYHIIAITPSGFTAPVTYTATGTSPGSSYTMSHSPMSNKLAVSGLGAMGLVLMDFNSTTGVLSNPVQVWSVACGLGNFSPDGSKLYFIKDAGGYKLHQYDLGNGLTTNMGTCCYAHDTKTGPDGKMYHIHTYSSSTPIAVINNPNLSAVGNACGYVASAPTIVGAFSGESRRFPEFVVIPTTVLGIGVEFTEMHAVKANGRVEVRWAIAAPCSGCSFEVERGNGRGLISVAGRMPGNGGLNYSWTDAAAGAGTWFYRVKATDAAGRINYSAVVQVHGSPDGLMALQVFPNPCQREIQVVSDDPSPGILRYEVMDMQGRTLHSGSQTASSFVLDVSGLSAGQYLLKASLHGKVLLRRFEKI